MFKWKLIEPKARDSGASLYFDENNVVGTYYKESGGRWHAMISEAFGGKSTRHATKERAQAYIQKIASKFFERIAKDALNVKPPKTK